MYTLGDENRLFNLVSNESLQWKSASFPALQQSLAPYPEAAIRTTLTVSLEKPRSHPSSLPIVPMGSAVCPGQSLAVLAEATLPGVLPPFPQLAFGGDDCGVLLLACKHAFLLSFCSLVLPAATPFLLPLCSRSPLIEMMIHVSVLSHPLYILSHPWELYWDNLNTIKLSNFKCKTWCSNRLVWSCFRHHNCDR